MISKIKRVLKKPLWIIVFLNNRGLHIIGDEKYLKILYKLVFDKNLDLINPQTFNEKIQWLKINDRKEIYTKMVDKYEVKNYVADVIGKEYIIPTIGIYNKLSDIDLSKLPDKFVMKCTHDSGGLIICKDKKQLNFNKEKKKIAKSLKRNFYYSGREWPYKNVKPRIIIEKYMCTKEQKELIDYKFFCFNGNPKIILVCSERFSSNNMCETWFDDKWNFLDIIESSHRVDKTIKKPINLSKMMEFSKKLSKDIPFVRVDFYEINGKTYFGELTFFPASGFERFEPKEWDYKLGEMLKLPDKKISDDNEK